MPDRTTEAKFHDMEYMVPETSAPELIVRLRDLTWRNPDDGMISPQSGRDTISLSRSGKTGTDYIPILQAVPRLMMDELARAHWGKIHLMTREDVERVYPRSGEFRAIRRDTDPKGLLLNNHLAELFG